jgi:glycosyltransferase involved in cell wall biosynthesis
VYLLPIHIPVYVDGSQTFTDVSWQRDLILARDWLAPPFGQLTLLSPSLPLVAADCRSDHLVPIGGQDGLRVVPSFDLRCRIRHFWSSQRHQWMADVRRELKSAKIVHCSAVDVFRPIWYLALMAAVKSHVPTVLVGPDMDPHLTEAGNLKGRLVCAAFDQLFKRSASRADLVLLKEGAVYERYARHARNGKAFCHSFYRSADVIDQDRLQARLQSLRSGRPLKAVYAGRFVARKGMADAIRAIGHARKAGVLIEYHLFGSGPEEASMRRQAADLGISDLVHFHGYVEYGPEFIQRLFDYDLLLFLPTEEDTPRMLYDAMAAGLPLVGSRIPFLMHRMAAEKSGLLVNLGDSVRAADELCRLGADRILLGQLSEAARTAGLRHSVDHWYQRRSEWTQEAALRAREAAQLIGAPGQFSPRTLATAPGGCTSSLRPPNDSRPPAGGNTSRAGRCTLASTSNWFRICASRLAAYL